MKAALTIILLVAVCGSSQSYAARTFLDGLPIKVPKTIIPWLADNYYSVEPATYFDDSTADADAKVIEELNRMLKGGGKRVRPLLTFLAAGLVGMRPEEVLEIARISEFTHTASLIHDDIIDKDNMRRGKKTTRGLYGDGPAVLMGDYLLALLTQEAITHLPSSELAAELMNVIKGMAVGERLQSSLLKSGSFELKQYQAVIREKTGVLFSWSMASPVALLKKEPRFLRDRFSSFAIALGELYQMRNDTDTTGYRKSEVNYVRWLASRVNKRTKAVKGPFTEEMLEKAREQAVLEIQKLGTEIQHKRITPLLRDSRDIVRSESEKAYWGECADTLRDVVDYLALPQ